MGRQRRRRQLVAGGVLLGLSLLAFWLGGPISARWPSAYLTVGLAAFGLFLVALWLFLLVIAEREGPPSGAPTLPTRPSSPGWWPFQRRQPPIPPRETVASDTDWLPLIWRPRSIPVLRRVDADGALELLLADDRGEGPIGGSREIVIALSTQDLLMMSAVLNSAADYALASPWDSGFSHDEALAWSRRAARAARDAPGPRFDPIRASGVGARRIGWTAWALGQDAQVGARRDPWFVVPFDQLQAVTNSLQEVVEGLIDLDLAAVQRLGGGGEGGGEDGREARLAGGELTRRLRDVLRHAHESDPAPAFGPTDT